MSARRHAFVAMPFGTKPDSNGVTIDFNVVYDNFIKPALEAAGLEVFRADEEMRAGDIRTDMFQELLMADLVVADLTIDNPNVWYELGVRHALRSRGVVLVCGGRVTTAFDLYTDRKLRYGLQRGALDPATLDADRAALAKMVIATLAAWHGRSVSPVYDLLPHLTEPQWKTLRIGNVGEFWARHDEWQDRIELARRNGRVSDILVLADEAPIAAFRAEAALVAGIALRKAGSFAFALEQIDLSLAVEPENLQARQEKGLCLQRLALARAPGYSLERARAHYQAVLEDHPRDAETWALLGRVDKDAWTGAWNDPKWEAARKRSGAADEEALLARSIDSYSSGYRAHPAHYYSGINALTLMHLHEHLCGAGPYTDEMAVMAGAVRYAAACEADASKTFWSKATLGDLEVLTGTPDRVKKAFRDAIVYNDQDWFTLHSCRAQLVLLQTLDFRAEVVAAGIAVFDHAIDKLTPPDVQREPSRVLLFSGHMVDAPDRPAPRFPATMVDAATQRIAAALDEFDAGPDDIALCQAAAGGDLLFLEACLARSVRCRVLLPLSEPQFIAQSILPSSDGTAWRKRYYDTKARFDSLRIMPDELGPLPAHVDAFERCNLWLLYSALAFGADKIRFVYLWNAGGGDGPGGTGHMVKEVQARTGRLHWIDTRTL